MSNRYELLFFKNNYSVKLNRAADYITEMNYTRTKALRHLDQGLLEEGENFIKAQFEYLGDNITGYADDNFCSFAVDFIENFYSPSFIEQYKSKEPSSFKTQWFTELNSILMSCIDKLSEAGANLGIMSGLALYSHEKHVSRCHFNAICDRLPFSVYLSSLERVGLNMGSPSGIYMAKIFNKCRNIVGGNEEDPLQAEFYSYFKKLNIPVPEISDKASETIRQSVSDYVFDHPASCPEREMKIQANPMYKVIV